MSNLEDYLKVAFEINNKASLYLLSKFGTRKDSTHKTDSHWGIAEDIECNKLYEKYLKETTPEIALYTEEGEQNLDSEYVWVVDPIEGTSNYKAVNPFWATQIALLCNGEPVIGVVNAPVLGQQFSAVQGRGAFMNGKEISVSPVTKLNLALVDMVRGTKDTDKDWSVRTLGKIIKKVRTNRIFGACGLSISYSAAGITDLFLSKGANLYDVAPGTVIAREAGAVVTNFNGDRWKISDSDYICGNSTLVSELLKII